MLTILMATHNGAGTLPRVLKAYSELTPPPDGWRLIVIDNASTDKTSEVVKQFSDRLPLTLLFTATRGKNFALNEALPQVEGELVVFTDDDAVPEKDWLVDLVRAAAAQPGYDIFGGHIEPIWPEGLPAWVPRLVNLGATFAITPPGVATGPISAGQIWGPNMAVRRSIFEAGHRFNAAVGPQGGQYMMGSEVEFTTRLEKAGHKAWFVAESRVGHIIRPHQVERAWIVQRGYRLGRHMFHQEKPLFPSGTKFIRGAPRWKYATLVDCYFQKIKHTLVSDFDGQFLNDWEISFLHGYLTEANHNRNTAA